MNYKESLKVIGGLLDALDRDKHGDYFYEHGLDVCEEAIRAYGALENQPFWISVEDALPDDSFLEKEIIVCILNRFGERNVYTKKFWGVNSALWNNDITHWMPLPPAPEVEV